MIGDVLWERLGACVDTISGDRGQRERERTIAAFRDGRLFLTPTLTPILTPTLAPTLTLTPILTPTPTQLP